MSEPKTVCSSCGCQILQRTADKNGGKCGVCQKVKFPVPKVRPPLTRAQLDDVIIRHTPEDVIGLLFNHADDKLSFRRAEMTEGDIIVHTVSTFEGETLNGGIQQYLDHQSVLAHHCGPALRRIGAVEYALIIEAAIQAFTTAKSARDPQWQVDLEAFEEAHEEPFEEFVDRYYALREANEDELQDLLYQTICANRDVFAPFVPND